MAAVLNAADEVAVSRFLEGDISFLGISDCVTETYERMGAAKSAHTLEDIISSDREARAIARCFKK